MSAPAILPKLKHCSTHTHRVRPKERRQFRHWNTAVSFATTGRAIALFPTTMVYTAIAVAVVPIAEEGAELVTWLLYRDEPSPAVSLVLELTAELSDNREPDLKLDPALAG